MLQDLAFMRPPPKECAVSGRIIFRNGVLTSSFALEEYLTPKQRAIARAVAFLTTIVLIVPCAL